MTEVITPSLIGAVAIAIAIGVLIGVGLMLLIQRSQTGGKTLENIRQEHDDYQQTVEQHFERSAVLFKKLTDDYREFYEHMASGAHNLCREEPMIQSLDLSRPGYLADTSSDVPPGPDTADQGNGSPDQPASASASEEKSTADKPAV